jgi:uncharacterized protein DUF6065
VAAGDRELIAFYGSAEPAVEIVPAPRKRAWMSGRASYAQRCLPMVIANESGWFLLNPTRFSAVWTGADAHDAVEVRYDGARPSHARASGEFGFGILTFGVPYLFRTPRGVDLLARGPSNWPKDGVAPLEGLVETDWAVATFTMNWKLTRPGHLVTFEAGEPFCMIVPQQRADLETFRPVRRSLSSEPATRAATKQWAERRDGAQIRRFLDTHRGVEIPGRDSWEKDYYRGTAPDGTAAEEHVMRRSLGLFETD